MDVVAKLGGIQVEEGQPIEQADLCVCSGGELIQRNIQQFHRWGMFDLLELL